MTVEEIKKILGEKLGAKVKDITVKPGPQMYITVSRDDLIEALRVLKAFEFVTTHEGQVCPADWEEGKDAMSANSEGMRQYLATH